MSFRWLLWAKRWAQDPSSGRQAGSVLTILAACAALYLVDLIWDWSDWLTPDRPGRVAR